MSTQLDWLAGRDSDPALADPETGLVLTYAALDDRVRSVASQLSGLGVGVGDVVAYSLPNGPEAIVLFLAVITAGAAAAPLNPACTREEVSRHFAEMAPRLVVADAQAAAPALEEARAGGARMAAFAGAGSTLHLDGVAVAGDPPDASADALALLLHTSGTTGRPKIVPLRRRNLLASARSIAAHYGLEREDVSHCVMPLFHVHGLVASTLAPFASGGSVTVPRRFRATSFWQEGATFGATWFSAVPTIHQILIARASSHQVPEHGLRFARSCSSALPPAVMREFEEACGIPLVEAYGMTEAAHQMASNPLPPGERKPGSVGVASGAEIGIVDAGWTFLPSGATGEVVVRGVGVVDGYLDNPEANAASFRNGWFRTGDSGLLDADGYLHLAGRIKELINRGGEKISPLEVEEVLLRHAAVAEAVAFAAPDRKYGEVVEAAVVLRDAAQERALREHCAAYLAEFKVPERIAILDEIPKGPTGKIQRRLLSELIAGL